MLETDAERLEREKAAMRRAEEQDAENRARVVKKKKVEEDVVDEYDVKMPPHLPKTNDIKELAGAVEGEIFETYYKLMKNPSAPPAVRKACADALADRAKGRPEQAITQTVKVESVDKSLEDVARMLSFAMRDAREKGKVIDIIPEVLKDDK